MTMEEAWDINKVEKDLQTAFDDNSETKLLALLKDNSFLFYELFSRKMGVQPVFREVSFGGKLKCDFAWLNDNSDGPEWVLVEVEKPKMRLFNKDVTVSSELNKAIEQVKSWQRYFAENPLEKKRVFGAVARFKYILVCGDTNEWKEEYAAKWRAHENSTNSIEIKSSDVFNRALNHYKEKPTDFWSFEENTITLPTSKLEKYWQKYEYLDNWRKIL